MAQDFLNGYFLIATPAMEDPRFERAVIYVCAHGSDGAMGLVINAPSLLSSFTDIITQLELPSGGTPQMPFVVSGGPVEPDRGFVLHSNDYSVLPGTTVVTESISLTATADVLEALALGEGPTQSLVALGYAGWGKGQLEAEIAGDGWLVTPAVETILFDLPLDLRYAAALNSLGLSLDSLVYFGGRA